MTLSQKTRQLTHYRVPLTLLAEITKLIAQKDCHMDLELAKTSELEVHQ